jgi:hypothetical protein
VSTPPLTAALAPSGPPRGDMARLRRRIVSVMSRLLAVLLVAFSLVGCGSRSANPSTDLTLLALNPYVGRAAFHVTCGPPGGDVDNPARACAALAAHPRLVTNPKPFTCMGGTFSWWDVSITGRLHGRQLRTHTSTCWTPQMAMIGRLGIGWKSLRAHLLPRRREAVLPSVTRTFPSGVLRPADLVTCTILGHKLENGVPIGYGTSSTGYGGANVTSVTLSVTYNRDGSVTASCHIGDA